MNNITWPKAFILGCTIIASALLFVAVSTPATSQGRGSGYMIAGNGGQFVWRVNTSTGAVSYCARRDNSIDEKFIASRPPFCSAESKLPK